MQGAGATGGAGAVSEQLGRAVERLNPQVQQQLNLESVKTRAISLFKAISRILEDFDVIARASAVPKWQDLLGQFSMVNLELFNIVEDIKKISKAFVVHPKNVNAENTAILPVMLSSKLLPETEMDDSLKRKQLLLGMQNLPVSVQTDKLMVSHSSTCTYGMKICSYPLTFTHVLFFVLLLTRINMIGSACDSAEKVIADTWKAYFGTRQGPTLLQTLDNAQAAKIQDQENLL